MRADREHCLRQQGDSQRAAVRDRSRCDTEGRSELLSGGKFLRQDEDFQEHYREAKEIHKQKQRELAQVAAELSPESKVTHASIVKFVRTLRTAIEDGSIGEKRSYLRSFIDNIEVGEDLIRIRGRRVQIEKAIVARQVERSAVPTFVREWRRDSPSFRLCQTILQI